MVRKEARGLQDPQSQASKREPGPSVWGPGKGSLLWPEQQEDPPSPHTSSQGPPPCHPWLLNCARLLTGLSTSGPAPHPIPRAE